MSNIRSEKERKNKMVRKKRVFDNEFRNDTIRYVQERLELTHSQAAIILLGKIHIKEITYTNYSAKEKDQRLQLSVASTDNKKVINHLTERGIDLEIIQDYIKNKQLYESKYINKVSKKVYMNVTFIGYDRYEKNPKYANVRNIDFNFKGDVAGSDKHFCFSLSPNHLSQELHIFESAIDTLSYATLMKMNGKDYKTTHLLSLRGVAIPRKEIRESLNLSIALSQYLNDFPEINTPVLHLDNDKAGRCSAKNIQEKL